MTFPRWGLASALLLLGSCTGDGAPGDLAPVTGVSPAITALSPSTSIDFIAGDSTESPVPATWSVDGIPGGNDSLGHITAGGRYTAPGILPGIDSVVITGRSRGDGTVASASLFFLPATSTPGYVTSFPRVVDARTEGTLHVFIVTTGQGIGSVHFEGTSGETPLPRVGDGIFLLDLPTAQAIADHVPGSLHSALGFLDYRNAGGLTLKRTNFSVNVRDAAMGTVPITRLAADAQASTHVVNIRVDRAWDQATGHGAIARTIQLLGDRFDQFFVVANVDRNSNRFHESVRNRITGIGAENLDFGAFYGSPARLEGVNTFPNSEYFDAGEAGAVHEFGHQWVNYGSTSAFAGGVPHWPPSSIANDVMGFSIGGQGGEGGEYPFKLDSLGGGLYAVSPAPHSVTYGPWDLYLMGLLPADSVPPALILPPNYSPSSTTVTTYTIAQYITDEGPRSPAYGAAPTDFNVATLVLSYGRLLSPAEMAFFDANAARGEATTSLSYSIGLARGVAKPFFVATGGRARLHMGVQ